MLKLVYMMFDMEDKVGRIWEIAGKRSVVGVGDSCLGCDFRAVNAGGRVLCWIVLAARGVSHSIRAGLVPNSDCIQGFGRSDGDLVFNSREVDCHD